MGTLNEEQQSYMKFIYEEMAKKGYSPDQIQFLIGMAGFIDALKQYPDIQMHYDPRTAADEILDIARKNKHWSNLKHEKAAYVEDVKQYCIQAYSISETEADQAIEKYRLWERLNLFTEEQLHDNVETTVKYMVKAGCLIPMDRGKEELKKP